MEIPLRISHEGIFYVVMVVLVVVMNYNSLEGRFIWDDRAAVISNKDVTGVNPWYMIFTNDFWGQDIRLLDSHKSYRPITVLSFRLDHSIYGLNAHGFHLSNVIIYSLTCCAFYVLAKQWINNKGAMVAALLFTVHPIHVENVASIVGRADCLCGLFYCCALVAYNRCTTSTNGSSSYKYLLAAWIFGLLASLSKEVGITVFAAFMVVEIVSCLRLSMIQHVDFRCRNIQGDLVRFNAVLRQQMPTVPKGNPVDPVATCHANHRALVIATQSGTIQQSTWMKTCYIISGSLWSLLRFRGRLHQWLRLLLSLLTVLVFFQFRAWLHGSQYVYAWTLMENHVHQLPHLWPDRALSYAQTHFWYLFKLCYPRYLCFDYGFDCLPVIQSFFDWRNLLPLCAYSLVLSAIAQALQHLRLSLLVALAIFLLSLLPALNVFVSVGTLLAERLLFVPSIGFCLMVAEYLTVDLMPFWWQLEDLMWHLVLGLELQIETALLAHAHPLLLPYLAVLLDKDVPELQKYMEETQASPSALKPPARPSTENTKMKKTDDEQASESDEEDSDEEDEDGDDADNESSYTDNGKASKPHKQVSFQTPGSGVHGHRGPRRSEKKTRVHRTMSSEGSTTGSRGHVVHSTRTAMGVPTQQRKRRGPMSGWMVLGLSLLPVLLTSMQRVTLRNTDWQSEHSIYASALTVCPYSLKALSNTAMLLSSDHTKTQEAMRLTETALQVHANSSVTLINHALAYQRLHQYTQAVHALERVLAIGTLSSTTSNTTTAAAHAGVPVKAQGYLAVVLYHWALTLPPSTVLERLDTQVMREWQETVLRYDNVLTTTMNMSMVQDSSDTSHVVGARADMMREVIRYATESLARAFAPPLLLYQAGSAALDLQDYPLALFLLRHSIRTQETLEQQSRQSGFTTPTEDSIHLERAYNQLGVVLGRLEHWSDAVRAFEISLRLSIAADRQRMALYGLSAVDANKQRINASSAGNSGGFDFFNSAQARRQHRGIQLDSNTLSAVVNLASALRAAGRQTAAKRLLRQYIEQHELAGVKVSPVLFNNLGHFEQLDGRYSRAMQLYERASQILRQYEEEREMEQEHEQGQTAEDAFVPPGLIAALDGNMKACSALLQQEQQLPSGGQRSEVVKEKDQ